jgi:type IV pilus assembly protein PilY1
LRFTASLPIGLIEANTPLNAASVAHYGLTHDINAAKTGDQKVQTFVVALASPLPPIEIPVNGQKMTLVPFAKSVENNVIADYMFAGDLLGHLWKFDICDANPANWQVAYTDGSGNPAPLYVAKDSATPTPQRQPITVRPEVGLGPGGVGMIVLFGTGKYVESSDKLLTPERHQSSYGIIDTNTGLASHDIVSARSTLQQQTIDAESTVTIDNNQYNVRVTSKNKGSNVDGWYIDLVSPTQGYQAEKQVARSLLRNGRVIFTTLIPDSDPCKFGGTSWLMELDALTGSRLEQ